MTNYRRLTQDDETEGNIVSLVVRKTMPDGEAYTERLGVPAIWKNGMWVHTTGRAVEEEILSIEK